MSFAGDILPRDSPEAVHKVVFDEETISLRLGKSGVAVAPGQKTGVSLLGFPPLIHI